MTFLFDWMSLLFMGFVFIISSLVILYRDDYMFGDLNIVRFIVLVLIFVISIIFLISDSSTTTAGHTLFGYPRCCEYS
jgi:NADH-ubiquinone oxidoreductase chain 5